MITKNTTLKNILDKPGAEEILMKHNLPCLSCPMAAMEISELKLGEVCEAYGLNLNKILQDLNKKSKNNKK
jgi:hybrid cluster-associated redox disulfide protein